MQKAIGSKINLSEYDTFFSIEFNECIGDLLELEAVQELDKYFQHCNTSRLQHSINVSYYSYLICKLLHFKYKAAARGGLLHDLFHYDWRTTKFEEGNHAFNHPKIALENARKNCELNEIEEDAIVNHMWPLSDKMPRYKESMVVSFVDKYCAVCEVLNTLGRSAIKKVAFVKNSIL